MKTNFKISLSNDTTVPAKWVIEPEDTSVSVGSHVAIHCSSKGYPLPQIKWKQAVGKLKTFFISTFNIT